VFVPGLILVTSSFVTFWIEWNMEPARVMLGVTTMLNFFTTSNKFRSKLPVVSNLTAMNMWDGVCMFFIYASFLEFIVVNYLARWVQDPETQKKKRENAILDSLRIVTTTLDLKHPQNASTLGGQLHHLGGNLENKLKEVKHKIPAELVQRIPHGKSGGGVPPRSASSDSEKPTISAGADVLAEKLKEGEEGIAAAVALPQPEEEPTVASGYTLNSVKKIDTYSRRIFPFLYILFVLYFFIRYHHIEGALSVH
jgi:Neurotransmitter-gated ion-channel transmembrane region